MEADGGAIEGGFGRGTVAAAVERYAQAFIAAPGIAHAEKAQMIEEFGQRLVRPWLEFNRKQP
jgi:hypothetical protein